MTKKSFKSADLLVHMVLL